MVGDSMQNTNEQNCYIFFFLKLFFKINTHIWYKKSFEQIVVFLKLEIRLNKAIQIYEDALKFTKENSSLSRLVRFSSFKLYMLIIIS